MCHSCGLMRFPSDLSYERLHCKPLHNYHTRFIVILKTKTRTQGGSLVATLPTEVARRLAVKLGQELYWREAGPGTYLVTALDPVQIDALEAMEEAIDHYREVFDALAK